ncbi:tRNA N6-adenosine threonylcarbamoyltransferase [Fibrobacterales bacterium]|nr:tRNA N6-adenosine threonylcarbamoyltransferase [Fibrobacterales bacterium]
MNNLWLGIETSCDDTACAVLLETENSAEILSNELYSQIDEHKAWGGVVPELASRAHLEKIVPVVETALQKAKEKAGVELADIGQIAFTRCPGLMGSLLVGANFALGLAKDLEIAAYGIHHLEGHLAAALLNQSLNPPSNGVSLTETPFSPPVFSARRADEGNLNPPNLAVNVNTSPILRPSLEPPFAALIVSGGHTELYLVKDNFEYVSLGRTRDDAAGEAFDKCGKIMGLGYPAGAEISRLASGGDPHFYEFPRALQFSSLRAENATRNRKADEFLETMANLHKEEFSFSGLKTAVSRYISEHGEKFVQENMPNICASLQEAIVDILSQKAVTAAEKAGVGSLVLGGGVSANARLRELLQERCDKKGLRLIYPQKELCTDNGAMIAYAAILRKRKGKLEREVKVKSWNPLAE